MENGFNKNIEVPEKKELWVLQDLRELRTEYIDDIPEELVTTNMTDYDKYKCRTNFFTNIQLRIDWLKEKGLIVSDNAIQRSERFLNFCTIKKSSDRYKREDINMANETLDTLIRELS